MLPYGQILSIKYLIVVWSFDPKKDSFHPKEVDE